MLFLRSVFIIKKMIGMGFVFLQTIITSITLQIQKPKALSKLIELKNCFNIISGLIRAIIRLIKLQILFFDILNKKLRKKSSYKPKIVRFYISCSLSLPKYLNSLYTIFFSFIKFSYMAPLLDVSIKNHFGGGIISIYS